MTADLIPTIDSPGVILQSQNENNAIGLTSRAPTPRRDTMYALITDTKAGDSFVARINADRIVAISDSLHYSEVNDLYAGRYLLSDFAIENPPPYDDTLAGYSIELTEA